MELTHDFYEPVYGIKVLTPFLHYMYIFQNNFSRA